MVLQELRVPRVLKVSVAVLDLRDKQELQDQQVPLVNQDQQVLKDLQVLLEV